ALKSQSRAWRQPDSSALSIKSTEVWFVASAKQATQNAKGSVREDAGENLFLGCRCELTEVKEPTKFATAGGAFRVGLSSAHHCFIAGVIRNGQPKTRLTDQRFKLALRV